MIKVNNLTQTYSSGKGVFNLDFTISEGEVFGYLGPNGAGKTTTIRNLMGFVNPDKGGALINGLDCRRYSSKIMEHIGYLPGEMTFLENMTGFGFIRFMEKMRGTKNFKRRDVLIEKFELDTTGKIRKMSKGMKQKLGLVTAFMHDPSVYILDEPSSGLDPLMQNKLMSLLEEEKSRGKTILMSSHIFEEVQHICDRAGIIRGGRIAAIEDVAALNKMRSQYFKVTFKNTEDADKILDSELEITRKSPDSVEITAGNNYSSMFSLLAGCSVKSFEVRTLSLEDVFMKYYGRGGKDVQ